LDKLKAICSDLLSFLQALLPGVAEKITGGAVAAVTAIIYATGGSIPHGVVWGLVSLAFFVAAFRTYRHQMRIIEEKDKELTSSRKTIDEKDTEIRELQVRIVTTPTVPAIGKTKEELEALEKKRIPLADALNDIHNYRKRIENSDPANYFWHDSEDVEASALIDSATKAVEFAFGNDKAAVFRSDAGMKKAPRDSQYPRYTQVLIRLEAFELRLIEKIKELE